MRFVIISVFIVLTLTISANARRQVAKEECKDSKNLKVVLDSGVSKIMSDHLKQALDKEMNFDALQNDNGEDCGDGQCIFKDIIKMICENPCRWKNIRDTRKRFRFEMEKKIRLFLINRNNIDMTSFLKERKRRILLKRVFRKAFRTTWRRLRRQSKLLCRKKMKNKRGKEMKRKEQQQQEEENSKEVTTVIKLVEESTEKIAKLVSIPLNGTTTTETTKTKKIIENALKGIEKNNKELTEIQQTVIKTITTTVETTQLETAVEQNVLIEEPLTSITGTITTTTTTTPAPAPTEGITITLVPSVVPEPEPTQEASNEVDTKNLEVYCKLLEKVESCIDNINTQFQLENKRINVKTTEVTTEKMNPSYSHQITLTFILQITKAYEMYIDTGEIILDKEEVQINTQIETRITEQIEVMRKQLQLVLVRLLRDPTQVARKILVELMKIENRPLYYPIVNSIIEANDKADADDDEEQTPRIFDKDSILLCDNEDLTDIACTTLNLQCLRGRFDDKKAGVIVDVRDKPFKSMFVPPGLFVKIHKGKGTKSINFIRGMGIWSHPTLFDGAKRLTIMNELEIQKRKPKMRMGDDSLHYCARVKGGGNEVWCDNIYKRYTCFDGGFIQGVQVDDLKSVQLFIPKDVTVRLRKTPCRTKDKNFFVITGPLIVDFGNVRYQGVKRIEIVTAPKEPLTLPTEDDKAAKQELDDAKKEEESNPETEVSAEDENKGPFMKACDDASVCIQGTAISEIVNKNKALNITLLTLELPSGTALPLRSDTPVGSSSPSPIKQSQPPPNQCTTAPRIVGPTVVSFHEVFRKIKGRDAVLVNSFEPDVTDDGNKDGAPENQQNQDDGNRKSFVARYKPFNSAVHKAIHNGHVKRTNHHVSATADENINENY